MKSTKTKIEEIRSNGYELDFGTVFEHAFENYKKIVVYAGLMLLVFSFILSIVAVSGLISYIGLENLEEFRNKMEQMSNPGAMTKETAILVNLGILLFSALINPFMAGFLKMADCGEKGEEFHISTMFSYYKFPYFINIFISVFIIGVVGAGIAMLFELAGLSFIGTLITILISFLTFLTTPFIIFGGLNAMQSITSSVILVLKQPLVLLGLVIVARIASFIGVFGLCIGIFFTMPFMYSMIYIIYKSIIDIDDTREITQIGIDQD